MKTALVLSSYVSASRVGATASAFCLRRLGIEAIVLPTTVLGRHPGWGSPGGQALETSHLEDMWEAIKLQNIQIDAVMTGYLASDAHVALASKIISDVKTLNPKALILVDPVMGDHGQLYIPESRAQALIKALVPQADWITPNLWELSYMNDIEKPPTLADLKANLKKLSVNCLVTSVPFKNGIGALLSADDKLYRVHHKKFETVPHGGGDALAGTFLAHLLKGHDAQDSFARAVGSIFSILSAANASDAGELPLTREQHLLADPYNLTLDEI